MAATKKPVEGTLGSYESSTYGKELFISRAKVGKTIALVGNALGVFPWNAHGGIVDKPEHLHVMTFDAAALSGALKFLTEVCGAPKEIANVKVYNLQGVAAKAFTSKMAYDPAFPAAVYTELSKVQERAQKGGTHCLIISSLTMMAKAWVRSISGPAFTGTGTKSAMDQNKWGSFKQHLPEFQWQAQSDYYHTLWEAHHGEKQEKDDGTGQTKTVDTIQVDGASAVIIPANVERIWEIKRIANVAKDDKGKVYHKSLQEVWFNPFPRFDFGDIQTGRNVSGVLTDKEFDLPTAFHELGLEIGGWGT